jgi:hypothetical protein
MGTHTYLSHAHKRKLAFDRKLLSRAPREVIFKAGQLVQVYRSDLDFTFKAERKMEPKWSAPRRVQAGTAIPTSWKHLKDYPSATGSPHDDSAGSFPAMAQHYMRLKAAIEKPRSDQEAKEDMVQEEGKKGDR